MLNKKYFTGKYNPFEINSIYFDSRSGFGSLVPKDFNRSNAFWLFVLSSYYVLRCLVASFLRPRKYSSKDLYDNKLLFVLPTLNNQRSLQKVIGIVQDKKNNVRVATRGVYSGFYVSIVTMGYFPTLLKEFQRHTKEEKRLILYYLHDIVLTPGLTRFYFRILQKYRPECVVMANDHLFLTKSLELVCEDLGIKTIYVQHASVSYAFPELHFAYSFLDGKDSVLKYTAEGKKCASDIIMLGAARYDALGACRINRKPGKRNCIGVAINELDDNKTANDFCNELLARYPDVRIKIRTHPGMKNKPFVFDNKDRIIYTCATDENIIDYLDSIDFQVSGDSGVHLDAILGGVSTIAFNFTKSVLSDNYEYIKRGLVKYASDIDQIFEFAHQSPDVSVVRYYDESYQKSYSGKCSEIIANFILHGYNIDYLIDNYGLSKHEGFYSIDN